MYFNIKFILLTIVFPIVIHPLVCFRSFLNLKFQQFVCLSICPLWEIIYLFIYLLFIYCRLIVVPAFLGSGLNFDEVGSYNMSYFHQVV